MALHAVWTQLDEDLNLLSALIRDFAAAKPSLDSPSHFFLRDECLLEGILSRVWQVWNRFCRNCVIESCVGTVDAVGTVIAGLPEATRRTSQVPRSSRKSGQGSRTGGRLIPYYELNPRGEMLMFSRRFLPASAPPIPRRCWRPFRPVTLVRRRYSSSETARPTTTFRTSMRLKSYVLPMSSFRSFTPRTRCFGSNHSRTTF